MGRRAEGLHTLFRFDGLVEISPAPANAYLAFCGIDRLFEQGCVLGRLRLDGHTPF